MLKYIDINSTYRDRKTYPLVGDFTVPVNSTPKLTSLQSTDPVLLSYPYEYNLTAVGSTVTDISLNFSSVNILNFYRNSYLEINGEFRKIIEYNNTTFVATVDQAFSAAPPNLTPYTIRKRIPFFYGQVLAGSTSTQIVINSTATTNDSYDGMFIFLPGASPTSSYQYRPIKSYDATTQTITIYGLPLNPIPVAGDVVEILPFNYDNVQPLVVQYPNIDFKAQDNKTLYYEYTLLSISIPILNLANGYGTIMNYPYIYVAFYNQQSSNFTSLFTNNPNPTKAVFKIPVTDLNISLNYLILYNNDMKQTIRVRPIDDIHITIYLPDGQIVDFIYPNSNIYNLAYPVESNPLTQISLTLEMKKFN